MPKLKSNLEEEKPPGTLVTGVVIRKKPDDLLGVHLEVRHGKVYIQDLTDEAGKNPVMTLRVGDLVFELDDHPVDEIPGGIHAMRRKIATADQIKVLAQRQDPEASSVSTDSEYNGDLERDVDDDDDGWGNTTTTPESSPTKSARSSKKKTPKKHKPKSSKIVKEGNPGGEERAEPQQPSPTKKKKKKKKPKNNPTIDPENELPPPSIENLAEEEDIGGPPKEIDIDLDPSGNMDDDEPNNKAAAGGGCCIIL